MPMHFALLLRSLAANAFYFNYFLKSNCLLILTWKIEHIFWIPQKNFLSEVTLCGTLISSREEVVIIFAVIKNFTKEYEKIWGRFLPACCIHCRMKYKLLPAATTFRVLLVLDTMLGLTVYSSFPLWGGWWVLTRKDKWPLFWLKYRCLNVILTYPFGVWASECIRSGFSKAMLEWTCGTLLGRWKCSKTGL